MSTILAVAVMMLLTTTRVWLLYFDLKYTESIIEREWWQELETQDWYIKNRKKWGSWKRWLWKVILIVIILWSALTMITAWFAYFAYLMTFGIISNGLVIFCSTLFCKMPKHYDVLLIRKEVNRLAGFYLISTIMYVI